MTLGQVTTTALTLLAAFACAFRQDEVVQDPSRLVELHSPPEVEDSLSFEYMEVHTFECIHKSHALLTLLPYISETFESGT